MKKTVVVVHGGPGTGKSVIALHLLGRLSAEGQFDYVGVNFGLDLRYDWETNAWVGDRMKSFDTIVKRSGDQFVELVKNTYRVLFTRGIKGCYVHFMDEDTRRFVQSRTE